MTSISAERANLAKVGLRLRRREEAGFRFRLLVNGRWVDGYSTSRPVDEPATRVFVHITVTNAAGYTTNDAHARAIESIGISRFGNTGVSYNRLIMMDGTTYEGQPIGRRGAHTVNDKRHSTCQANGCPSKGHSLTAPSWNLNVNARAYAICQNVRDQVSDVQLDAVARCIAADMLAGHVSKSARIHGHRCVSWKDCPGSLMWARMAELKRLVDKYVKAGTVGQQLPDTGEEDDMPFTDWPKKDREALAKAVADEVLSRKNSTSDRNIMFHTRRGDNATAHFTSLVSGNDVSLATAARHAQQKSTEARNVLVPRITSPISGNDVTLRSMWSYQYRDINRARDENKSAFKAVQGEIAQVKATLAAQGALLKQVLERPGQPIDMKAIESAALVGAQQALRELDVRIEIAAADEPEIPDPVVDVITDGSDEPQLDEDEN